MSGLVPISLPAEVPLKKRLLAVALTAGATVLATPGVSSALVSNTPEPDFPTFNGTVHTIIHRGDIVYVGGSFTRATDEARTVVRNGAAAFNRTTGDLVKWKPNVKGTVLDMAWSKEGVYLVGKFKAVKGKKRKNVALVKSTGAGKLMPLNIKAVGVVQAVGMDAKKVYIGGKFTKVAGQKRGRLAAFNRKNGKLAKWAPIANDGPVQDLRVTKRGVFVGGFFHAMNGKKAHERFALLKRKNGALVTGFNPRTGVPVMNIAVGAGTLYAALGGPRGGGLEAVNRGTGARQWERRLDGDVQAVSILGGTIYAGGHFNQVCDRGVLQEPTGDCEGDLQQTRRRGASFLPNGDLTDWNPNANTEMGIEALDAYADREQLLAGGAFTFPASRFAVFAP